MNGFVYFTYKGIECKALKKNYPLKKVAIRNLVDEGGAYKLIKTYFEDNFDGDLYRFPKQHIKDMTQSIILICHKHGEFKSTPSKISRGVGCKKCQLQSLWDKSRRSVDKFIEKAKEVHGEKYDYSKVVYVNSHTKVEIICKEHGVFLQEPNNHIHGKRNGCPQCGQLQRTESVRNYARNVGYTESSRESYVKRCPNGTNLYIFKLTGFGEVFYKIGLSVQIPVRKYTIEHESGYTVEVLDSIFFEDSGKAFDVEQEVIKSLESYKPKRYFKGETECFLDIESLEKPLKEFL